MYIRFFTLFIAIFCMNNSFAQKNISVDIGADKRNSWILGNALLNVLGEDRIAELIDRPGFWYLRVEVDDNGEVLQCYRCFSRNFSDSSDSTAIIDYLKKNNIRFTYGVPYELLEYSSREHLVDVSRKEQNRLQVFFPGEIHMSKTVDKSKYVLHDLSLFHDFGLYGVDKPFNPTSEDQNNALLFTSLIYQYGENTVVDWLKNKKKINIVAISNPDGQVVDVKCKHSSDSELPESLREDIMNLWKLYDCRLKLTDNKKKETKIKMSLPSCNEKDIYNTFRRMRYINASRYWTPKKH